ncbi:hypothetical protein FOV72_19735 [Gordonia rubripertincta]|uniref:hypothetical protein n=1 Tax=Gordonia rubripertincta TaxID=36822 RepID=UPI00117F204A|nr:hypothetical protein [Gordonia rubripertincta]TSD93494.1 hypothetical protein FOV72_19735 [Gordonia rubripertincta]
MVSNRIRLVAVTTAVVGAGLFLGAGQASAWPWDDLGGKAEDAAKGLLSRLVNAILYALISLMKYVMSFFTAEKTNLDQDSFTSMIEWANSYTFQLQSVFLFGSIVVIAGKFAIEQWTGGSQHAVTTGISVSVRSLATSLGAATVVILLTRASDIFAAWIYDDTGKKVTEVTDELKKKIGTIDSDNFDGSSMLLVIIALIAVLGCLDLLIQLFLRLFYLAFGTAVLPVAAASTGTDGGQATYNQVLRLIIAMIAFKPICAGAFSLAMSYPLGDKSDAADVFIAVLLYIAPILCLPTLLSLVGVGGSVHGRVSGLAGVAAIAGFARVGQRAAGRTGRGATGLVGRVGGGGGGGRSSGGGPGRPSGTSPTPRGGGGGRPGGGGGGRFSPASSSSGGGGTPRSSGRSPAASTSGGPRSQAHSASASGGRHAQANSDSATGGAGRRGPEPQQPNRERTPTPRDRDRATSPDSGSPRTQRPTTAPPRRTVGSARAAGGDRRSSARNVARRNLGANYIGRR